MLLVLCCDNDFGDLARNKMFALGEEGELVERDFGVPEAWFTKMEQLEAQRADERSQFALVRFLGDLTKKKGPKSAEDVAAANEAAADWLKRRRREYREYVEGGRELRFGGHDTYDADIAFVPGSESSRAKRALMGAILAEFRALCAGRETPFAMMLVPSSMDICERKKGVIDPQEFKQYRPQAITDAYVRLARKAKVPCLDLFQAFVDAGGDPLYFRGGDEHWNPAGQALAASEMANFLLSEKIVER